MEDYRDSLVIAAAHVVELLTNAFATTFTNRMRYAPCPVNPNHRPTDQERFPGCWNCTVEQMSGSTSFFTPKHLWTPGSPVRVNTSYFTYDPTNYSLSFLSSGQSVFLSSQRDFVEHWLDLSRSSLLWNHKHKSPNILVHRVEYGLTGLGSTQSGQFTYTCSGIIVAKAFGAEAHPYPIEPAGPATRDLITWPWVCPCGGMCSSGSTGCQACAWESMLQSSN